MLVCSSNSNYCIFYIAGFARVLLTILSCFFMANSPSSAMWCYFIGSFLDAFDGHAARYFNQSTWRWL